MKSRDYTSLESVFRSYYSALYAYGMKLSGNDVLVKDCIQDVFAMLWKSGTPYDSIQSMRSYLFASLRRRIVELRVSQERRSFRNVRFAAEASEPDMSPEDFLIMDERRRERNRFIEKVLHSLTDRQQETIYLRFYSNLSYGEIAQILNMREQSVRNQVCRALKTIRERLIRDDNVTLPL